MRRATKWDSWLVWLFIAMALMALTLYLTFTMNIMTSPLDRVPPPIWLLLVTFVASYVIAAVLKDLRSRPTLLTAILTLLTGLMFLWMITSTIPTLGWKLGMLIWLAIGACFIITGTWRIARYFNKA